MSPTRGVHALPARRWYNCSMLALAIVAAVALVVQSCATAARGEARKEARTVQAPAPSLSRLPQQAECSCQEAATAASVEALEAQLRARVHDIEVRVTATEAAVHDDVALTVIGLAKRLRLVEAALSLTAATGGASAESSHAVDVFTTLQGEELGPQHSATAATGTHAGAGALTDAYVPNDLRTSTRSAVSAGSTPLNRRELDATDDGAEGGHADSDLTGSSALHVKGSRASIRMGNGETGRASIDYDNSTGLHLAFDGRPFLSMSSDTITLDAAALHVNSTRWEVPERVINLAGELREAHSEVLNRTIMAGPTMQSLVTSIVPEERLSAADAGSLAGNVYEIDSLTQGLPGFMPTDVDMDGCVMTEVSWLKDVDGDGCSDAIFGLHGNAQVVVAQMEPYAASDPSAFGRLKSVPGSYEVWSADPASSFAQPGVMRNAAFSGNFGKCVAGLPDWDGDGYGEAIVGVPHYDGNYKGAIWLVYTGVNGTAREAYLITDGAASNWQDGPTLALADTESFGQSCTGISDMDGDGINELAVGTSANPGNVYVLFVDVDDAGRDLKAWKRIGPGSGAGFSPLITVNGFGFGVAPLDVNGDGLLELVASAPHTNHWGPGYGAAFVLFFDANARDGSVASSVLVPADPTLNPEGNALFTRVGFTSENDAFGEGVAALPDLDGDGVPEVAVVGHGKNLWIVFLRADGHMRDLVYHSRIATGNRGGATHLGFVGYSPLISYAEWHNDTNPCAMRPCVGIGGQGVSYGGYVGLVQVQRRPHVPGTRRGIVQLSDFGNRTEARSRGGLEEGQLYWQRRAEDSEQAGGSTELARA